METIGVNLGERSYDIAMSSSANVGEFAAFVRNALPKSKMACVVCDANIDKIAQTYIHSLTASEWIVGSACVPSGESSKSLQLLNVLYDVLAGMHADRNTAVIAVGGGVIGDLAGFAAATYNRGIPLIMVPTTLLAMVDSSVGGKTGINHATGKNLIGAFHQPAGVWIDTANLATLPDREYRSGLAEVVKYGVILDAEFFEFLEKNTHAILAREPDAVRRIVRRSCELKATVVENDELERTGLRAILNYGHTFAHAFETVGGYGSWLHGEAVAAGMICASRLAQKLGRIDATLTDRQVALLRAFELPTACKPEWKANDLIDVMRRDKKSQAGKLRFVLPTKLGHVELVDGVAENEVVEVLTNN